MYPYIFEKPFGGEYIWGLKPAPPIPQMNSPPKCIDFTVLTKIVMINLIVLNLMIKVCITSTKKSNGSLTTIFFKLLL